MPDKQRVDLVFCHCREFAGFADEFECDGVESSFLGFRVNANAVPKRFINKFVVGLDKRNNALGTFFDAEFAHAATRADVESFVFVCNGGERTDFYQRFRRKGRDKRIVYFQRYHFAVLLI